MSSSDIFVVGFIGGVVGAVIVNGAVALIISLVVRWGIRRAH